MATATLKASLIEPICQKRTDALRADKEAAVEKWISDYMAKPKVSGVLFWKRSHYPTRAEAEADFKLTDANTWWSVSDRIEERFAKKINPLVKIELACREAQERGDGKVTLDHNEIATVRAANMANGDAGSAELEAA